MSKNKIIFISAILALFLLLFCLGVVFYLFKTASDFWITSEQCEIIVEHIARDIEKNPSDAERLRKVLEENSPSEKILLELTKNISIYKNLCKRNADGYIIDVWGNPLVLRKSNTHENEYQIVSKGRDNISGTSDDVHSFSMPYPVDVKPSQP